MTHSPGLLHRLRGSVGVWLCVVALGGCGAESSPADTDEAEVQDVVLDAGASTDGVSLDSDVGAEPEDSIASDSIDDVGADVESMDVALSDAESPDVELMDTEDTEAGEDSDIADGTVMTDLGGGAADGGSKDADTAAPACDAASCDDGNPCTVGSCGAQGQCVFEPAEGACDDGNVCTTDDHCAEGVCSGTMVCECETDSDCADDGDLCNGVSVCDQSELPYTCVLDPASIVDCSGPCILDGGCDGATGQCHPTPQPWGTPCPGPDDAPHRCQGTVCVPGCDDGEACTDDVFYPEVGCTHTWARGCGGQPCGECPAEHGFECVPDGENWECANAATDERWVPGGTFWMGCNPDKAGACNMFSVPQVKVWLPGFAIDRFPVTGDDWLAAGYFAPSGDLGGSTVSEDSARAMNYVLPGSGEGYCDDFGQRLCTEPEWEKAGRGGCSALGCAEHDDACCLAASAPFPWGHSPLTCDKAQAQNVSIDCTPNWVGTGIPGMTPKGQSVYGVEDLIGTASEWVRGLEEFHIDFVADPATSGVVLPTPGMLPYFHLSHGSMGTSYPGGFPSTIGSRALGESTSKNVVTGFRCCRTPDETTTP